MRPQYTFQLLAPHSSAPGRVFRRQAQDDRNHARLLKGAQRLRARLYLQDGAISQAEVDLEGCFRMPGDGSAWHLLLVDGAQSVIGCARYLVHPSSISFEGLRIAHSPLVKHHVWGKAVRAAVESDLKMIQEHQLRYVEVGGWALAEEWRGTRAALEIAVGSFALGLLWGGAIGSCTATARHSSAAILRRLGGEPLACAGAVIPPYYDPAFDCEMELLRFDYRNPAERYVALVDHLAAQLVQSAVLTPGAAVAARAAEPGLGRAPSELSAMASL